jgi:PHD/YefM family antitoxin component YafN of YafNO toxin-antitoxin module
MVWARHTQSLTDFSQKSSETLDRLNQTGEAEILTVNGEARAVLLSPAAYDALSTEAVLARDAVVIRRSIEQLNAGQGLEVNAFFDGVRAQLLAMKAQQARVVSE